MEMVRDSVLDHAGLTHPCFKDVSADKSVFFTSDELTESVTSHVSLLGRD